MKKTKFLAIVVAVLVALMGLFSACKKTPADKAPEYEITLNSSKSFVLTVGDEVDFAQYFVIKDKKGLQLAVTEDMLDLSRVNTSTPGMFTVTVSIGSVSKTATFLVKAKTGGDTTTDPNDPTNPNPPGGGNDTPSTPTNVMEKQIYNPSTFDKENLQEKIEGEGYAIGLSSIGTYHALVIPVQFSGDTITQEQLDRLEIAFNGTSEQTGWESVRSYYQKASYGKLNMTFDIQDVYHAPNNASYYANYYDRKNDVYGDEVLLEEALAYYEPRLDLTQYDFNDDQFIDAVYLIYSAPVDYDEADFYWAYTTWYWGDETYDNLDAYYYFFAGFDFMDESTTRDQNSNYDVIPGLKVNAATYIHETGHLLGLDDYYDYEEGTGCNEGLGSADMMDYTVGDQNVYSKIMLGWLEPTIVNTTQTVTISSSCTTASAILIPLNFNNSYFCEYLLIDLYAAQGLNALHASMDYSYLYDGANYGVRIYHVSSSYTAGKVFDNNYGSFTDYNNSDTDIPLIKLVEADGESKFASTNGWASDSDLWKTGNRLSQVFPNYKRNDGKIVNFDIVIGSVSATEASITITFN